MTNDFNDLTDDEFKRELIRLVNSISHFVRLNNEMLEAWSRIQEKMDQAAINSCSTDTGLNILSEMINANIKEMFGIPNEVSHEGTVAIAQNVLALMHVLLLLGERGTLKKIRAESSGAATD